MYQETLGFRLASRCNCNGPSVLSRGIFKYETNKCFVLYQALPP